MSVALATIAPTLDKLIRRLGSNHDGERLATVAAIDRVLKTAGRDWHDLADAVTWRGDDWRVMAEFCRGQAHRLTPREFDFINNIAMRDCEPSEKQWKWLRAIFSRLGGEP
jgi:IS5 family transposase